jgi:redox-sensitive bicupin YhaK (pirin superfamily)
MDNGSKAKIFLGSERGHTETDWFRSYHTFIFGAYQSESKTPFGPLYVLNDDTLGGGKRLSLTVEEDSLVILLPTVGAVDYKDSLGNAATVCAGQVQAMRTPKGTTVYFSNPFEEALVNFLQLWIKAPAAAVPAPDHFSFDLEKQKGLLVELFPGADSALKLPKAFLTKMMGRGEIGYDLSPGAGLFVFVLQGAFEVQNRLLEGRDSLALWDAEKIEIEALSNEAILLLLELPLEESA